MRPQYIGALHWIVADPSPVTANTLGRCQKLSIDVDIIICHAPGGEALLEAL
jgi:hypothetical protein